MKLRLLYTALICSFGFFSNAQLDRSIIPFAQPNPAINIPTPNQFTLDNGLKVIVVENHKQPKVSFQLYTDYAVLNEGNKAGVSDLMGELLGSGTMSYSKDVFDEKMDFMGANFYPSSRGFFATSLSKHTPKLLELLSSVITEPAFTEDEFTRLVNQTISGLSQTASSADDMASNVSSIVNYGEKHPYGEIVTEQTISNITLDDVKTYYNNFAPNSSYLVIVGDITEANAKAYANTYFGKWEKSNAPKQQTASVIKSTGNQVYFIDKPGAVQSVIKISHSMDIKPGSEDELKLKVLNKILGGGGFSARLMKNLREDKAYTYGCYSRMSSDELVGIFTAGGNFRNEVTDSAIVQILKEIQLITEDVVNDDELDLTKKSMTGAFARSLENPQTVARFALNTIRYNLPANYYATYLQKLEKVTKEEMLMAVNNYLNPKNLNIIVVGNSEIAEKLVKFDTDGKISYKDPFGKDVVMLKAVAEGVTAKTVINNFILKSYIAENQTTIDAKNKKIAYIKSTATTFIPQMNAEMTLTTYKAKPNKTAMSVNAGEMTVQKDWFNGEKGGSFVMMQADKELTAEEIAEKQAPNFPFNQLYYYTETIPQTELLNNTFTYFAELLGIEDIDGVEYYKIKITETGDDDITHEFYNKTTGLLDITEQFTTDPEGNAITVKMIFSDYQVQGKKKCSLLLPTKYSMNTSGQKMDFELKEVLIKTKAKTNAFDGEFDQPNKK